MPKEAIMFGKTSSNSSLKLLQSIAVVFLALTVLFGSVGEAYAWSYGVSTGRPGTVRVPTVYVGDLYMPYGMTQFTLYSSTGPVVNRSPASSGEQIVAAVYTVEKLVGSSWVKTAQTGILTGRISSTQTSYQFPALYIQPQLARGIFRVTWLFTWSTSTGTALGGTTIVSNYASDHSCVTPYRLCRTYPGSFRAGGYLTGAW
jgi:hypothetical protein